MKLRSCSICGRPTNLLINYRGLHLCEEDHGWLIYREKIFLPSHSDQQREMVSYVEARRAESASHSRHARARGEGEAERVQVSVSLADDPCRVAGSLPPSQRDD